jgi:hypothetical protein
MRFLQLKSTVTRRNVTVAVDRWAILAYISIWITKVRKRAAIVACDSFKSMIINNKHILKKNKTSDK